MGKLNITNEFDKLNNKPTANPLTIDDLINKCKVEYSEKLDPPPTCLQFITNGSPTIVGTMGNFSTIIGKAKSRKTYLASLILASAVRKGSIQSVIDTSFTHHGPRVILFDTEQSKHKVQQIQHRIIEMAGVSNPLLDVYSLRELTPDDRIKVVEEIINKRKDIGLMVIDGIRDLVYDINNPEEATRITTKLLQWTGKNNFHLITILHQNKGDNNARGHLGTEIVNKAESIISVTKQADNKEISIVEAEYCREKDFEPFAFKVDEKGHPAIMDEWLPSESGGKRKLTPYDIPPETHRDLLSQIFKDNEKITYGELYKLIKNMYAKHAIDFGDTKAKDILTYYKQEGLISGGGKDGYQSAV